MSGSNCAGRVGKAPGKISVYILAANRLLREALEHTLKSRPDIKIVGSEEGPQAVLETIAALQPNVVLINGGVREINWTRLIAEVRQASPQSQAVLFGMEEDTETFFRAIRAGVAGYVSSESPATDLALAVRRAACGEGVCPPRLCLALFRYVACQASNPSPILRARHGLTRREQQLLPLIAQGLTNKEIASRLALSEQTVKNHIGRILRKMGARDRLSAAYAAAASAQYA
jgi:DNA-binding NarL/FixJ family response regulator